MIGYILAIISSVFFSLYVVPRKLAKQNPVFFSLLMTIGFFIGSILLYSLKPILKFQDEINTSLLYSIIAGFIWVSGFICLLKSIDIIGLARSNQWKNLQGPIGVFLSLFILQEYTNTNPTFALLAGIAIFISAIFFTTSKHDDKSLKQKGVFFALLSAIAFGVVTVINKHVVNQSGVYAQQVVWSFGMVFGISIYIFSNKALRTELKNVERNNHILGLIAGFLYLGASFFMLQSYRFISASIGFTIIQMNALWTVLIGIIYFKEINFRESYKKILIGIIFTILGIFLLLFARR